MQEVKKQGGKRANAGRKKVIDRKIPVTIYLKKSFIEKFGADNLKLLISKYCNELIDKI